VKRRPAAKAFGALLFLEEFFDELILGFASCDFFAGFFGEDASEDRVDVAQVAL